MSTQGVKQNTASFDTVGLFARAVEDLALFRAAVTGFPPKPLSAVSVNELKIGFCRTMFWDRAENYTKTFLEEAAGALAKAGAKVADFALGTPFEQFQAMGTRIHDYEFSRGLTWERTHHWNLISQLQRDNFAGWLNVSYEQYREAEAVLEQCRRDLADSMKDIDLLLTPSAPGEAPPGLSRTGDTSFNNLATWTYTPCITLPVFSGPSGLPVGIQLIGHRNQDHRLLEAAQTVYRVFIEINAALIPLAQRICLQGKRRPRAARYVLMPKDLFQPFQWVHVIQRCQTCLTLLTHLYSCW